MRWWWGKRRVERVEFGVGFGLDGVGGGGVDHGFCLTSEYDLI